MTSIVSKGSTSSVQGRSQGPLRASCEVLAHRRLGAYHSLTFVAPEVAERSEPGQFVVVGVEGRATLLRRPFSIFQVSRHGPWAGTVEVVFEVVGPGTRWLAERQKHDTVDLVGPLGRPFPIPAQPVSCLLVGGGYGAAPLLFLAQALQQHGLRVDMVLGAAIQERIFNPIEAKRVSATTVFTTEDGSLGTQGVVTDVLDQVMDQARTGVVYACGPMPMLAAVARVAQARHVPCQVAVEEAMGCGTGVCWTCVLPYRRKEDVQNLRACIDGPVFNANRVVWDDIGPAAFAPDARGELPHDPQGEFRP